MAILGPTTSRFIEPLFNRFTNRKSS
jgi:hypothetical protein